MNREQFFVDSELYDNLDSNYNSLLIKYQKQKEVINKAIQFIYAHLQIDILSDFTGVNYTKEYMDSPDELLDILKEVSE